MTQLFRITELPTNRVNINAYDLTVTSMPEQKKAARLIPAAFKF